MSPIRTPRVEHEFGLSVANSELLKLIYNVSSYEPARDRATAPLFSDILSPLILFSLVLSSSFPLSPTVFPGEKDNFGRLTKIIN
jgi:hypothetical protein